MEGSQKYLLVKQGRYAKFKDITERNIWINEQIKSKNDIISELNDSIDASAIELANNKTKNCMRKWQHSTKFYE